MFEKRSSQVCTVSLQFEKIVSMTQSVWWEVSVSVSASKKLIYLSVAKTPHLSLTSTGAHNGNFKFRQSATK
jgi:hypothetical protein